MHLEELWNCPEKWTYSKTANQTVLKVDITPENIQFKALSPKMKRLRYRVIKCDLLKVTWLAPRWELRSPALGGSVLIMLKDFLSLGFSDLILVRKWNWLNVMIIANTYRVCYVIGNVLRGLYTLTSLILITILCNRDLNKSHFIDRIIEA